MDPISTKSAIEATMSPRLQMDEHGHAIPPNPEEREARTVAVLRMIEEIAAIPDDPPGSDEEFWRAIDEGRPDRPLFREFYEP